MPAMVWPLIVELTTSAAMPIALVSTRVLSPSDSEWVVAWTLTGPAPAEDSPAQLMNPGGLAMSHLSPAGIVIEQ